MLIRPAQSLSGLSFSPSCSFARLSSNPIFLSVHPPLTLSFPHPHFLPLFLPLSAALSSLSLGGHLGRDKACICGSTGSLPCRQVMIQTHSQAHSCRNTHTHTHMQAKATYMFECRRFDSLFLYVSNRSRNRVGQMLKKHRRDTSQRALTTFTVKIKGWKIE